MIDRPRVLVVEDDATITEFVALALQDEGYRVTTALDGLAALRSAAEDPPALILLDMRMPVLDGIGFAAAYRQHPAPHAPIIVLTASRDANLVAADVAADAVLAKPFALGELLDLVERYAPLDGFTST